MSQRTQYQENILDHIFSHSLHDLYTIDRKNSVEMNYPRLEDAFVEEYGKVVGSVLFNDICDEIDVEQKAYEFNQALAESHAIDFTSTLYDTLSTLNQTLYARNTA